ncbi:CTP synthase [Candidatus Koribacter versatilis Ellin345]|uniref:CTP synthase (glutamine hydrolyzing) n=1 Tax=Koribacter versatilis (strain Ellin345) TaxID=204669 RepID=Q1IMP3_KORVE|nr:CTP synthase [Candidatus Koribacter versatilis]ABF41857.1 CTP synthase [Candidatus Koribacter versatilis Ellin345]
MAKSCRVALLGDYNAAVTAHQAIPEALRLAGQDLGVQVEWIWLHTSVLRDPEKQFADFSGVWCVPASPYANTEGVLEAIRYAREQRVPFLGTCGGFQHAVLEFARNVLGIADAEHAENNPGAGTAVITPLACSLVEQSEEITLGEHGILREAYGKEKISEGYRCSYGVNPEFQQRLFSGALKPAAWGASGEIRGAELDGHPFFVGTLFQSERRALKGEAPPLAIAFLDAMN